MVPLSKSGVRKHRGFESRPLRHARPNPDLPASSRRGPPHRGRGRLVDYGAALEMRFGATRRGFESRPLRHSWPLVPRSARNRVSLLGRARRGTSGALYLQSAPAGLNPLPRSPFSNAAGRCDVEDRVPRSGEPRTVSGPEGSSTKRSSSGAAERPGPSRSSWWARDTRRSTEGARHLISPACPDQRRS